MKIYIRCVVICFTSLIHCVLAFSQDLIQIYSGANVTINSSTEVTSQGGISAFIGSAVVNNGIITLNNNSIANQSNWTDNSIVGILSGAGKVVFNSTSPQTVSGKSNFYDIEVNCNKLTLGNNNLQISNTLKLTLGKVHTSTYAVVVTNSAPTSVTAGTGNTNFANSYMVGNVKRSLVNGTSSIYNFPVGDATNPHLLSLKGSIMIGTSNITCYYAAKLGTDAGLSVSENGVPYTSINTNGVWYMSGDTPLTSGSYLIKVFTNTFTGLVDNRFAILHRPLASSVASAWKVPVGSTLPPQNTAGRTVAAGFAYRSAIASSNPTNSYGQFGIGQSSSALRMGIDSDLSFTGKHEEKINKLAWETADNQIAYFEIQKINADSVFQTIGKVTASNQDSIMKYNFNDFNNTLGENNYKLKLVTKKDAIYSEVVSITATEVLDNITFFPNPVQQVLNLNINASESKSIVVSIIDGKGIEVSQSNFATSKGLNTFELNIAHLATGEYYIRYLGNLRKDQMMNFIKID